MEYICNMTGGNKRALGKVTIHLNDKADFLQCLKSDLSDRIDNDRANVVYNGIVSLLDTIHSGGSVHIFSDDHNLNVNVSVRNTVQVHSEIR